MSLDYRSYPILYVDDEPQNLVSFQYVMDGYFTVIVARSGEEALTVLAEQDIAVLLSDQRMPGMSGVEVCRRAREIRPQAIRMILTAYADLHAAIDAINHGHVSRYLVKPWRNEEMIETLRTAIDIAHMQRTVQSLQMRLLRTGASAAVASVYDELVHELSNPLGALEINASLVTDLLASAKTAVGDAQRAEAILTEASEAQADSVVALRQLRGLLARARQGRRPKEPVREAFCDAGRVVDATIRIVRHEIERAAKVELVLESSTPLAIDASVLGQVVLNLLLNAAQALRPETRAENRVSVRVAEAGEHGEITVVDNGPGIAPEHLERIFDPFFTTKESGSGIGLAVCRDLVTQAGGSLKVQSEPGRGAAFTISLPLAKMPGNR